MRAILQWSVPVAIYDFHCDRHGAFEVHRPIGQAPAAHPCPDCGAPARRVVSAPMVVGSRRGAWSAAIERAERSRHEPEVVSSVPSAGARPRIRTAPMTPQLARLPRP
jgi:putative FmdB family regulatory protein